MGALSLTALAVSGLELPAWPDRHVLVAPPFIEPVSLSVHRAPFEPTSLRASRAPDGAHHVPGFEPAEARFMMSDLTGMPYMHPGGPCSVSGHQMVQDPSINMKKPHRALLIRKLKKRVSNK